jgi:hypothetical protein
LKKSTKKRHIVPKGKKESNGREYITLFWNGEGKLRKYVRHQDIAVNDVSIFYTIIGTGGSVASVQSLSF